LGFSRGSSAGSCGTIPGRSALLDYTAVEGGDRLAEIRAEARGPLFTDGEFHNTGVPPNPAVGPDRGQAAAIKKLLADEFNCLGRFSDARPSQCPERLLVRSGKRLRGTFKPPSLRGMARRLYMHAGQLRTFDAVLEHYNRAPRAVVGKSELHPLGLGRDDLDALEASSRRFRPD
jgi:cytochrome c peroxidase